LSNTTTYVWKQVPLFRAIWPFIAGIILAIFLPNSEWLRASLLASALFFVLALIVVALGRRGFTSLLLLSVFLLGYAITVINTDRMFPGHVSDHASNDTKTYVAQVVSNPILRARSVKMETEILRSVHESDTNVLQGRVLVYVQPTPQAEELRFGDEIVFHARLNTIPDPQNPSEFNYKRYMHFHQVSNQVYLDSSAWRLTSRGSGFRRLVFGWQSRVIETIRSFDIEGRELAILSALLVGYKHHLTSEQVNAFASAGAMHVLAVSGLHVGIVFIIIHTLLQFLDKHRWGRISKGVLMIAMLWLYAMLTGLSPSVTRAATMFTFVIVAKQFRRRTDIFNTLASSAFALLLYNPFLIVEVGFQLSYLAVLGIVLLQPRIYDLWTPKWWVVDKMWAITAVSLAAQAATFPLALLYFHQFPNYFLLSNLVVIPAATLILPAGIALVSLHWIPYVSSGLAWVLYQMVHWLDWFIQWVEQMPYALILGIDIGIFETYLIYMIVAAFCAFLITKRFTWLAAFLIAFIVVESLNIRELALQKSQKLVVFYRLKKQDAINFIDGREQVFMADSSLVNDFDKMRFHVHHHWWNRDLLKPQQELNGLYQSGPWIQFEDMRILVLDSATRIYQETPIDVDLLFVKQRTNQHPKELFEHVRPSQVLLSSKLDWKSHRYWKSLCEDQKLPVHSLRNEGAFIQEL